MARRKHADLIHAWAEGAKIETKSWLSGEWEEIDPPSWDEGREYRVKATPKLYQSRVEIPKPLTVEGASALEVVFVPAVSTSGGAECNAYLEVVYRERYAKLELAYRTPEDAIKRAEAWLKTELGE